MTLLAFKFILAVLLLNKSADWFARGAALVAELTGMPRLWMGAILAGFVTSIPEFVVSGLAAGSGHSAVAVGNSIGSVTFNCVLLGICLVSARTALDKAWFRDHGIPMLVVCLLLFAIGLRDTIRWPVALVFLLICVFYGFWSVLTAQKDPLAARVAEEAAEETIGSGVRHRWYVAALLLGVSIPLIFASSRWVLSLAVRMAEQLGIGEAVIALTLVAIGTSLPELATTIAATRRGHLDTSIGLIFGSNIFVGAGAIGVSGLCGPLTVTAANRLFDLPVMMLVTGIPFVPLLWGKAPGRIMGYLLLLGYAAYVYALFTLYGIFE